MQCSSRVSACRRELNSHDAAKPRTVVPLRSQSRPQATTGLRGTGNRTVLVRQVNRDHSGKTSADDLAPLCPQECLHCVETAELQFVRGAAGRIARSSPVGAGGLNTRGATASMCKR